MLFVWWKAKTYRTERVSGCFRFIALRPFIPFIRMMLFGKLASQISANGRYKETVDVNGNNEWKRPFKKFVNFEIY